MAFWRKKRAEFEEMDQIICEQPGIRPAELAQRQRDRRAFPAKRWRFSAGGTPAFPPAVLK